MHTFDKIRESRQDSPVTSMAARLYLACAGGDRGARFSLHGRSPRSTGREIVDENEGACRAATCIEDWLAAQEEVKKP